MMTKTTSMFTYNFYDLIGNDIYIINAYSPINGKGCGCSSKNTYKLASSNMYNQLGEKKEFIAFILNKPKRSEESINFEGPVSGGEDVAVLHLLQSKKVTTTSISCQGVTGGRAPKIDKKENRIN